MVYVSPFGVDHLLHTPHIREERLLIGLLKNFSMYSLISMRMSASSLSNILRARARASSVLPTPVGPKNMKEPMGFFGPSTHSISLYGFYDLSNGTLSNDHTLQIGSHIAQFGTFPAATIRFTGIPVII